jgi:hypothetical protein
MDSYFIPTNIGQDLQDLLDYFIFLNFRKKLRKPNPLRGRKSFHK